MERTWTLNDSGETVPSYPLSVGHVIDENGG